MGRVTTKFNVRDYITSDQYPEVAKKITPSETDTLKLWYIHTMLILPIQKQFEKQVYVASGLRDLELNRLVYGTGRQHLRAEAVDFLFLHEDQLTIKAFNFIMDEMYHQTGWCYLSLDKSRKKVLFVHWALPLLWTDEPRQNPKKFWVKYDGDWLENIPTEAMDWKTP